MNETSVKKNHNGILMFTIIALCFLLACFVTLLSFYHYLSVKNPIDHEIRDDIPVYPDSDYNEEDLKNSNIKLIKVVFNDGPQLGPDNSDNLKKETITPGYISKTNEFTVSNKSDVKVYYCIKWQNVYNDFVNKADLRYHIVINGKEIIENELPNHDQIILDKIPLNSNEVHNVEAFVQYVNRDYDQSVDMSRTFAGVLIVDSAK